MSNSIFFRKYQNVAYVPSATYIAAQERLKLKFIKKNEIRLLKLV